MQTGLNGTAGVVYSSDKHLPWYAVISMRIGFDNEDEPTILLCTDGPPRSTSVVGRPNPNKHCLLGFDGHKAKWFPMNDPAFLDGWLRGDLDNSHIYGQRKNVFEWYSSNSRWVNLEPSVEEELESTFLSGLCIFIIKGDANGMNGSIPCLNLRVRIQKKKLHAPSSSKYLDNPGVWTVDLTRDSFYEHPETLLSRKKSQERKEARKEASEKAADQTRKALSLAFAAATLGAIGRSAMRGRGST